MMIQRTIDKLKSGQQLRESEAKYRRILETTSEGYWLLNSENKIMEVNKSFCKMLGCNQDEMLGKTPFDFFDDENRKIFIEQNSKIWDTTHCTYEITLKKKNGQDLHTYFKTTTIRDKSGRIQGSFAFIADITEHIRTQQERNLLAIAFEQASESIFITDRNGKIQYVNPAFERLTGYAREEAIHRNTRFLRSGKHDDWFFKQMWNTISRGDVWHGRVINRKKDGSFYEADASISPVSNKSGKIINFVSIDRDRTHEIELEKQLFHALKIETIGTLAGGIAHDFNNILTSVIGFSELALNDAKKGSIQYENLQEVLTAGNRAINLVKQILTFSRETDQEKKPVQIKLILEEVLNLIRSSIPTTIEIKQNIQSNAVVMGDSTHIHQVIMNLCTNAAHAMKEKGGILTVGLSDIEINSSLILKYPDLTPGTCINLTVTDTGHGMTPDVLNKIFDPFFTTKNKEEGTGMGLSVVHGIVRSHGGGIYACSEPGKGSTFKIFLPAIQKYLKPEDSVDRPVLNGTERILLVDDESAIVNMSKQTLESLGYDVVVRTSSIDAMEYFRNHPESVDLVITDMTMPNMTGDELAVELMKIRPDIPVILCTGFSTRIDEQKAKAKGIRAFVLKPIIKQKLSETIRKVLE